MLLLPQGPDYLSSHSETEEEKDGHSGHKKFSRAGARTPPWSHERPNLLIFTLATSWHSPAHACTHQLAHDLHALPPAQRGPTRNDAANVQLITTAPAALTYACN